MERAETHAGSVDAAGSLTVTMTTMTLDPGWAGDHVKVGGTDDEPVLEVDPVGRPAFIVTLTATDDDGMVMRQTDNLAHHLRPFE